MRALALAGAILAAGCTSTNKCKSGTVLVTASFDAAARAADELDVVVQLDQLASMSTKLPGPGGHASGTIQVEFPSGYHAGGMLQVSVSARLGGALVADGSASTTLAAGCSSLEIPVAAGAGDGGAPADMTTLPIAVATSKPDLVGFSTTLDGSGSSDPLGSALTFAWSVEQAPAGSTITTAALTSTSAVKTGFEPDRGGLYKIGLSVTTSDGRTGTTVANVTVPTVPIFYSRAAQTATTYNLSPHLVASDGTGDRAVGCPFSADGGAAAELQIMPFFGHAYDPPAGGTPQFVFLGITSFGTPPQLLVATPSTDCTTSPPVRVDNNVFADHIPVSARFSPDGTRIVYVDTPQSNDGTNRLVTVAVDGLGPKRVVRSAGYFGFTPAIWLDNSTVAWVETDSNSFNPFTIFKAPDENAAGDPGANTKRTTLLRCDQGADATALAEINQFEMGPFGMIVAGGTSARIVLNPPPLAGVSLYKLADNDCSTTNAKTLISEPVGGLSWDFALSPDGLSILFSSTSTQPIPDGGAPEPQSDIFLVPADGSAAAQKIAGDPLYDDISPRFIAGGRQFIWTQEPRGLDMGADTPAILIANADGTHVRSFTPPAAAGETVLRSDIGANRGFDCSWVPGSAGAGAATASLGAAALLLLALVRRRRRD